MSDQPSTESVGKKRRIRRLNDEGIARREKILAVTRQMISEKGYDAVTMNSLAAQSGVAKKTLYDIYGSKEDLLAASISSRMDEILSYIEAKVSGRGLPRLFCIIRMTIATVLDAPQLSRALEPVLLRDPGRFSIREFFNHLHRQCLQDMADAGCLVPWFEADFLVANLMMDQIATQNLWAVDMIASDELEAFALLGACRILLPVATGTLQTDLVAQIKTLQIQLGQWAFVRKVG